MTLLTTYAIPGPETVYRAQLENGITVLVRHNPAAPVVVLDGFLPAGSIHEPAGKAGLSGFTASMLTRGSERYDFDTFNEIVESVGASVSAGGGTHVTSFSTESLSEDFPQMLTLLADILRHPVFPAEQVERVRGQRLVRLQEREQSTRSVASRRFSEAIYGDHPYGVPNAGYPETISAISREEMVDFHARRYTPNGAIVVVSGDIGEPERVVDLIRQHLGDWQGPPADQMLPPIRPGNEIHREFIAMPGKVQSDIVIGCLAVARSDPDYYAVQVANQILGRFGLMGRLGEIVREKQGLAYYSYSILYADLGIGPWMAMAGVNPIKVDLAVESILHEFARLGAEPVSAEELADSQANMTGSLPLKLETNEGVSSILLSMEWYGLGLDYIHTYADRINAVTIEDVQRVAHTYLRPNAYTLVVAGPELKEQGLVTGDW
ncbi:MAG: insulinase family protein [Caldilineaceae bacterium]|nr:insulinase family protein [Caldilineaceae bacterium]